MMDNEKRILEEVEKTLAALDDRPSLRPNPFLFTRIREVLASGPEPGERAPGRGLFLAAAALTMLLLLNLASVVYVSTTAAVSSSHDDLVTSLRKDYDLNHTELQ